MLVYLIVIYNAHNSCRFYLKHSSKSNRSKVVKYANHKSLSIVYNTSKISMLYSEELGVLISYSIKSIYFKYFDVFCK